MNLVFASGFFAPQKLLGIDYFRGLPAQYPDALFPRVAVNGSIHDRAPELARQIKERFPVGEIHIIAHSMGGLDSRYMLAHDLEGLAERVVSLSTVSTPHRGSPVADLLLGLLPGIDSTLVRNALNKFASIGSGALHDLSTPAAVDFNKNYPPIGGVRHFAYYGSGHISLALRPTHELIKSRGTTEDEKNNDGVVSLASARWPDQLAEDPWPADHLAQIGHNLDTADLHSSFDHKAAFARIIQQATQPLARVAGSPPSASLPK
jgi:triacylglycerol lipase